MIAEKETPKPKPLIETMKQHIKYLETNDPHNEILEVLKHHVAVHDLTFKTSQKGRC